MGTKRGSKVVTIAGYDQMVEELEQTQQSLAAAVKQVNDKEALRAAAAIERDRLRGEWQGRGNEIARLTDKATETQVEINRLKNSDASARTYLEYERTENARRSNEIYDLSEKLKTAEAKIESLVSQLSIADEHGSKMERNHAEHERTIARLDRYVCLATSRGRAKATS